MDYTEVIIDRIKSTESESSRLTTTQGQRPKTMEILKTEFNGLMIIKPKVFGDDRGYFFESYNKKEFEAHGIHNDFVQDNQSFSKYGTLRGLHYQKGVYAQAKLVRVLSGRILDVAVDLRPYEKTYKQVFQIEASDQNQIQVLIPRGFAHGFVVLSPTATFSYKCDNFYSPANEAGIAYNDPDLNIDWKVPHSELILSEKDKKHPRLKDVYFE